MIKNIDHIGLAVKSIEKSLSFYQHSLGMELEGIEEVESQKVKVAFLWAGNTRIELLEATTETSPIARFIEKRGEGIHHIALGVKNIEDRILEIKNKGITMIDEESRIGAHQSKVAFLHPKSTQGVLLEFCEREHEEEKS